MLLVVRFWEEFDENRDLARRVVGVFFALVVFRVRQNRRHSFTTCVRVLLRDQTRARKKSAIRSTMMRDAREKSDEYFLLFFLFFYLFWSLVLFLLFSRKRQEFFSFFRRSSIRCFQTKIKTTGALCALFLSLFSRITPMNAQKVEQQYTIVSSSREAAVCVRVRERVREQRVHDVIQLF